MADFNSIVNAVYTITNRPDLVAETQQAVKSATLQLHRQDYFYKDLFETALQFSTSDYIQNIDYRLLFPRYRSLRYLRKFDPTGLTLDNGVGILFKIKTPDQVLDSYGEQVTDMAYIAGSLIQIKSSTLIQYALIGVFLNPIVATPETYSSWISDEAFYAVVYQAASIVFGTTLRDSSAQNSNIQLAQMEMLEVKNSNIIAEGY